MTKQKDTYSVVGIMSGTSVDGIDLCACKFTYDKQWTFKIVEAETVSYSSQWKSKLIEAENCSGRQLTQINCEYGRFLGRIARQFIERKKLTIDLIASHGHTIFHQADKGYTLQIGHGAYICSEVDLPTISDFRSQDIAEGGQGAPLVPFGEKKLFSTFRCFLNLGGIANLSIHEDKNCTAFDISAANMVLNYLTKAHYKKDYDESGLIAQSGRLNSALLEKLNSIQYFDRSAPKSLGKEDVFRWIIPIINQASIPVEDKLNTFIMHLCMQIENSLKRMGVKDKETVLVSGGGAFNSFLINELKKRIAITLPKKEIIEYKEALIFGYLGLMRFLKQPNVLNSVTGAKRAVSAGSIFIP